MPACGQLLRRQAEQSRFTGVGGGHAQQQADCRGLARAVGAEQGEQLARLQLQVHAVERLEFAVAFVHRTQSRHGRIGYLHVPALPVVSM